MGVILVLTRGDLVVEGLVVQGELVHDDPHTVVRLQLLVSLNEGSGARQGLEGCIKYIILVSIVSVAEHSKYSFLHLRYLFQLS